MAISDTDYRKFMCVNYYIGLSAQQCNAQVKHLLPALRGFALEYV